MKNLIEQFQNERKIPAFYIKSEDLIKILGLKNVALTIFEDKLNKFIKTFDSGDIVEDKIVLIADIFPEGFLKDIKSKFAYHTGVIKKIEREELSQLYK